MIPLEMLFHVHCTDRPGALELRLATRAAHLDYLKAAGPTVRLAGPLLADDGQTPAGSVLVIDVADREAAARFCADDPYARAGLFERVAITAFRGVIWNAP